MKNIRLFLHTHKSQHEDIAAEVKDYGFGKKTNKQTRKLVQIRLKVLVGVSGRVNITTVD